MFPDLDATRFELNDDFFKAEFEGILSKIIACYKLMLADSISLSNDENLIRDVLLINYLKNNKIRKQVDLLNYLFDREVPEDATFGRTDIKIQSSNTFVDTGAYYTIECKRINAANPTGKTGLNAKYIENGIQRFVLKTYASHYQINGMIGFVVQGLDIHKNTISINSLLTGDFKHITTTQVLTGKSIVSGFDFCYYSTHNTTTSDLTIYHLKFDFSKNIK